MTEQPKPPEKAGFDITVLPEQLKKLGQLYNQWGWLLSIMGVKMPSEVDSILKHLAAGGEATPEELKKLEEAMQGQGGFPQPQVGEPVLTRHIAKVAWEMHYTENMSFRDIAETLTKDGYPCSHATVARYIEDVDMEMRFNRIGKLIRIAKYGGIIGFFALWTWIIHTFF